MNTDTRFLKSFGKRLAKARKQSGITQEKLAELVGLHRTYIGYIEQGKRDAHISYIHRIAKVLKISEKDLF